MEKVENKLEVISHWGDNNIDLVSLQERLLPVFVEEIVKIIHQMVAEEKIEERNRMFYVSVKNLSKRRDD